MKSAGKSRQSAKGKVPGAQTSMKRVGNEAGTSQTDTKSGSQPEDGKQEGARTVPPGQIVQPPHSCKIMWVKGVVRVIVTLDRGCPPPCINLSPTPTEFYLDTFKHSKKYQIRFEYPSQLRVDAAQVKSASFNAGVLTTELKIVDWGTALVQRNEILASHAKMLEGRGIKVDPKKVSASASASTSTAASASPSPASSSSSDLTAETKHKKKFLGKSELENLVGQIAKDAESKSQSRLQQDKADADKLDKVIELFQRKKLKRKERKDVGRTLTRDELKLQAKKKKILQNPIAPRVTFAI